jgi:hypothetical protein
MKNKRINYIVIPFLIVLLVLYSYQRISKKEGIVTKPNVEIIDSVVHVQIGNCYSYEEEGNYYGVIIVEVGKDHVLTSGILEKVEKRKLSIKDFESGNLMYSKTEIIEGYPVYGLWTGFFLDDDINFFKEKFRFIGKIELDKSKIDDNGGGTLINRSQVNLKYLHDSKMLNGVSKEKEPVTKIMRNN